MSHAADEPPCRAPEGMYEVAFPSFPVPPDERVVGFELAVKGARVVGIAPLPAAWSIKVDAEDRATEKVSGTVQRQADAVAGAGELPRFATLREAAAGALELGGDVYTSADSKTYVRHHFVCGELLRGKP